MSKKKKTKSKTKGHSSKDIGEAVVDLIKTTTKALKGEFIKPSKKTIK